MVEYSTGIVFIRSEITFADITDGASHTYLVGEKYMNPDHYETGLSPSDNSTMYVGQDVDVNRWTNWETPAPNIAGPPSQDQPGLERHWAFGSAHPSGCGMAMCDGSVQRISYSIEPEIHRRLGNRQDGMLIDGTMY